MDESRKSRVPAGRLSRLWHLGNAATRLAAGGAVEATQRLLGRSEAEHNAFLTLDNARALANRMSRLRGAAMKLGQMLSLEGDSMLPKEFADALAVLRDNADTMPRSQVAEVLGGAYGPEWETRFLSFDFEPIASASIGQVHRATARDGRRLALKIQYPGVARSIDSDVDNLATLFNLSRIMPSGVDSNGLIEEIKRQLHEEVDYERELEKLLEYRQLVSDVPRVRVPEGYTDLTAKTVLAMEYIDATPLSRWQETAPQEQRDAVGEQLIDLLLREFFHFGLVQTDPNFSNFFYNQFQKELVLFDFGATRVLSEQYQMTYRQVVRALRSGDQAALQTALLDGGFMDGHMSPTARDLITQMAHISHVVFERPGVYDFGASDLPDRYKRLTPKMLQLRAELKPPPPPLVFFQRKLSGTFLMCRGLRARIDCNRLADRYVEPLS